ncbi:MAG: biopolymer transporter ExbD [Pirellulales bacterium]|nr:biopolymer transporter ExbD [Pirellulales bacterium]
MTPMVDVTFLLLIFFMVTAAFSMQKSLEVPTPDEDKASTQQRIVDPEEGNIVVRIDRDSTIWVNESEAPSEQDLLVKLREAKQGTPGSDSPPINSLLVMADGEARHEVVIMVLDAGNAVQMEPIRLVTVDESDF